MGEENKYDEAVIVEERQRMVGYIGRTGKVCLMQGAEEAIIIINPDDVGAVVHALTDLRERAKSHPVEGE